MSVTADEETWSGIDQERKIEMEIIRYRTIAAVCPHYSLEAEVQRDDGTIFFANMDVNCDGQPEALKYTDDGHWAYPMPLDDPDWDPAKIVADDYSEVLEEMKNIWNSNPVFSGDGCWIPYGISKSGCV